MLARDVDDAEAVALGVLEDDVVRVRRALVPVDFACTELDEPRDFSCLLFGVEVEVDARRDLELRADLVERQVRAVAVPRAQQDEVLALDASLVAECGLPELGLALEIVHAHDDRADAEHG